MRWRTLITGMAIVATIVVYAAAFATVAPYLRATPWPVELLVYGIAGVAWILPLRWLVRWSGRDPLPKA